MNFKVGKFNSMVCQLSLSQVRVVFAFQLAEIYTDLAPDHGRVAQIVHTTLVESWNTGAL